MCAFCIRTARISRVVYALGSPIMGGMSRWSILCDDTLENRLPFLFRPAPEVLTGVLADKAQQAWSDWNPLVWRLMKWRNYLVVPEVAGDFVPALHANFLYGVGSRSDCQLGGRSRLDPLIEACAPSIGLQTRRARKSDLG